jgi:hypothetical protein
MSPSLGGYQRLRWAARITTMGAVAAALIYSFILYFVINGAGVLAMGTFALAAMFVGVALIAWQWSLVGGLCVVDAGAIALNGVLSTNYDLWIEAPFDTACVIYMIGGFLHLLRGYLIHVHRREAKGA